MLICICGTSIKITSIHLFMHVILVKQMTNSDAKNNVILQCGGAIGNAPKMFQFPLIYKLVHAWKYYYILNVQLVVNKFFHLHEYPSRNSKSFMGQKTILSFMGIAWMLQDI